MKKFIYNEDKILDKAKSYIENTYGAHYSSKSENGVQFWDLEDPEEAKIFFRLNAKKYIHRFGRKNGHNPDDLMKAIHYIAMLYHFQFEKYTKFQPDQVKNPISANNIYQNGSIPANKIAGWNINKPSVETK